MLQLIAQLKAEPLVLMSIVKPVLVLVMLGPWAWLVGRFNQDAEYFYLKQRPWAMAHIGTGVLGFAILLLFPIFWVGFPLALMILVGELVGYVIYRNKNVPKDERWSGMDIVKRVQKDMETKAGEKAMTSAAIKLLDKNEGLVEVPHGSDPRTPAFELFQNMVIFAIPRGADQLEMTVDANKCSFSARIDGIRYPQEAPEKELSVQLIDYLKEHAGMDLSDRRRKQVGQMWVETEDGDKHELRLITAGSTRALQLVIEIEPEGRYDIKLDQLGLLPRQLEAVQKITQEQQHVVLVSAPPKSGATTTLFSLLNCHDPYTSSVVSYEKEKTMELEGVNHHTFPSGASNEQVVSEFASLLRSDPNVMLVEQLLSTDMAQMAAKSSEDTRFYVQLPAKDTLSALKLWVKAAGDKRLAAESLGAIVSQRLVRKLCQTCRAPYQPDANAMRRLNIPKDSAKQLYKASGKVVIKDRETACPTCQGLGYRGRVGVFEVMTIDREARSLLASGEGDRLLAHLRKQRMVFLQEAALAKVVAGVTDIKEVTRVLGNS